MGQDSEGGQSGRGILVHEWLAAKGGSENVFQALIDAFPEAERWALWNASDGRFSGIHETWLASTPLKNHKAAALPLMPLAWRSLPTRTADWVLCSSHAFAHHARFRGPAKDAPTLVYAHTPARYVWVPEADPRGSGGGARAVSALLRPLDRRRAGDAADIAANSHYVAERIAQTWEREARVIYPPVDVARFRTPETLTPSEQSIIDALPDGFILGASRFVPYKRLDEAIRAGEASRLPVVLAGGGPDEARLRELAESSRTTVVFVGEPSADLLSALYRRASVMVFAAVEDFGIMPVEAMASGTPVIVNALGGASESVIDGVTGVHLDEWSIADLSRAVDTATALNADDCVRRAELFDNSVFRTAVRDWVREVAS